MLKQRVGVKLSDYSCLNIFIIYFEYCFLCYDAVRRDLANLKIDIFGDCILD